jgi:hypothetical protein
VRGTLRGQRRAWVASSLAMTTATPGGQTALDLDGRIAQAIAAQVVALVREELGLRPAAEDWIDASEVSRRFGLSRSWVYAHARQLGAVPIGSGPRPRLRFDPRVVADALRTSGAAIDEQVVGDRESGAGVAIHVPRVRSKRARS